MDGHADATPNESILIVDDSPDNLRVLTEVLRREDYRVRPVSEAVRALESAQAALPDLILLDIRMPGMDGFEVCRQLKAREQCREIPVIFISAMDDAVDKAKGFRLGAVDYITKPFEAVEILARVKTHLTIRKTQSSLEAANQQLQRAHGELERMNSELEGRVKHRTAELEGANKMLRALALELTLAEERERSMLAEKLHDDVSQSLAFLKMKIQLIGADMGDVPSARALADVCDTLVHTMEDVQKLTFELHSPALSTVGFESAVADWLREEVQQKHGIQTEFSDDGQPKPLEDSVAALVFRSIRELLANAIKHAHAKYIHVTISKANEQISVTIEDDGVGMDLERDQFDKGARGFGLFSVYERLHQLGGSLELTSKPGQGVKADLRVPLLKT